MLCPGPTDQYILSLNGHDTFYMRVRVVVQEGEVLKGEIKNIFHIRIEKHFGKRTGFPAQLQVEVRIDPFDDKPLRTTQADDRFWIYSIDRDLVDDGGNFGEEDGRNATDVGFSVPAG